MRTNQKSFLKLNRGRRAAIRHSEGNGVYYSFTLQAAQSGSRFHPPHFAGVCTVRITGLGSAGNPLPIVNRFLTLSAVTK
jgi:hypothetical protein